MHVAIYPKLLRGLATKKKREKGMSHYNKISAVMLAMRNEQSKAEKIKIKVKGVKNGRLQGVDTKAEKLQFFSQR